MEEAFQQAGAPCVPQLGIGAAYVGNGQKVERAEAFVGLDAFAESIEYVGVLDVFFLGDGRHQQVVFDQPGEQVAFFSGQEVVGGKLARVCDALYGMVAAASFGDVMEKGGKVEDVLFFKGLHQCRGVGQLVAVHIQGKAADVADDGEDVVVHGIDVEQVVLEQADDFFPRGQVASQYAVEVEEAQGLGQSVAVAEKAGEAVAVFRILVEAAVDFARRAPPCAQGLRFERGNIVALLHDFDDFENVFGPSEKNIGVPRGDLVVDLDVVVVNPQGNAQRGGGNAALQHRREDAAQLFDGFNRAVKHAHQFFALAAEVQAFITHAFGDLRLQIEQQAVFGAIGV